MLPIMQSARPELADFTPPKSLQNGKHVDHKPMANTSLVNAVLKRIKAVKAGRGLWLKPWAKVKS